MVTMSYPGSKTAAVHTAVTAEFWYSGTNDFGRLIYAAVTPRNASNQSVTRFSDTDQAAYQRLARDADGRIDAAELTRAEIATLFSKSIETNESKLKTAWKLSEFKHMLEGIPAKKKHEAIRDWFRLHLGPLLDNPQCYLRQNGVNQVLGDWLLDKAIPGVKADWLLNLKSIRKADGRSEVVRWMGPEWVQFFKDNGSTPTGNVSSLLSPEEARLPMYGHGPMYAAEVFLFACQHDGVVEDAKRQDAEFQLRRTLTVPDALRLRDRNGKPIDQTYAKDMETFSQYSQRCKLFVRSEEATVKLLATPEATHAMAILYGSAANIMDHLWDTHGQTFLEDGKATTVETSNLSNWSRTPSNTSRPKDILSGRRPAPHGASRDLRGPPPRTAGVTAAEAAKAAAPRKTVAIPARMMARPNLPSPTPMLSRTPANT